VQPARIDACSELQAAIVVELSGGGRVLIDANASVSIVTAALKALQS